MKVFVKYVIGMFQNGGLALLFVEICNGMKAVKRIYLYTAVQRHKLCNFWHQQKSEMTE